MMDDEFVIVIEDDVDVSGLGQFLLLNKPADAQLIFLNDRMVPSSAPSREPIEALPITEALRRLDRLRSGPGGDGYALTPQAAKAMVDACIRDSYFGHVDGRILRYATAREDLQELPSDSWIVSVVENHHHYRLKPALGLIKGYTISKSLVVHRGIESSREAVDDAGAVPSVTIVGHRSAGYVAKPDEQAKPYPIRYWNRVKNIGDSINPYIIEALTHRPARFELDPNAEHLLGIGSVFFMATGGSHIWGAGIMDPSARYPNVDVERVHAVRGKLTESILQKDYGLSHDIALGDPGILIERVPEVARLLKSVKLKRRVGLIPHYALIDHPAIVEIAKDLDADIISPRTDQLRFIAEIFASEIIVSASLHGLIFAEALGKPSVWISHKSDPVWEFKFRDWYSMTLDPQMFSLAFGTAKQQVLDQARLHGLTIDKDRLAGSIPQGLVSSRSAGIGFRETRAKGFLLVSALDRPPQTAPILFDHELRLSEVSAEALRLNLNDISRQYDDVCNVLLVFDLDLYRSLSVADIASALDFLTAMPNKHYLQLRRVEGSVRDATAHVNLFSVVDGRGSLDGVIVMRHAVNFSLDAPGAYLVVPLRHETDDIRH